MLYLNKFWRIDFLNAKKKQNSYKEIKMKDEQSIVM